MSIKSKLKSIMKSINAKEVVAVPSLNSLDSILNGKTVLVTGGSSGIGYSVAERYVMAGAKVIISGRNEEKLNQCCEKIKSDHIKSLVIDLNDISSFSQKIRTANDLFPESKIDILVNCAGYNPKMTFFDVSEEEYNRTFDTNVKGTFFMCQAMSKYMIENHIKGHILNFSSSSALRPAWSPYEMSKWTIRGMTLGLADTLIPYGIVVNAIAPGPTATPMLGVDAKGDLDLPTSPIGRYATPDEIANLALIMVSDVGNLVVGDTLYATGGSGVISLHR